MYQNLASAIGGKRPHLYTFDGRQIISNIKAYQCYEKAKNYPSHIQY